MSPSSSNDFIPVDCCTLAHPLDRLVASMADWLIVLTPFLLLFTAPLRRMIQEGVLLDDFTLLIFPSILCLVIIAFSSVMYKFYFTWIYGGTFGQWLMSLRVVNLWEPDKRDLEDHVIRALYWFFSYLLLGLPFLFIMSDRWRRCLHDKVSDTVVLNVRGNGCNEPSLSEKTLVYLIGLSVLSAIGIFVYLGVYFSSSIVALHDEFEEEFDFCSCVDKASSEWTEDTSRLDIAMTLYAAKEITDSCLEKEVDAVYLSGTHYGMVYLANALVYRDSEELMSKYLETACGVDPESCHMSQIFRLWSEERWSEIGPLFKKLDSSHFYTKIWEIRYLSHHGSYQEAMEKLKSIHHVQRLADFRGVQTVQLYWTHWKRHEARVGFQVAMSVMGERAKLELGRWLCFEEREMGCEPSDSCNYIKNHWGEEFASVKGDDDLSLLFFKTSICEKKTYGYIKARLPEGKTRDLVFILEGSGEKKKLLENFLKKTSLTYRLRMEAFSQWVSINSVKELMARVADWRTHAKNREWGKKGYLFFEKLSQLEAWEEAYQVGSILLDRQPKNFPLQQELVVVAYRSGRYRQAHTILSDYQMKKAPVQRTPQSFREVVRQLGER